MQVKDTLPGLILCVFNGLHCKNAHQRDPGDAMNAREAHNWERQANAHILLSFA